MLHMWALSDLYPGDTQLQLPEFFEHFPVSLRIDATYLEPCRLRENSESRSSFSTKTS